MANELGYIVSLLDNNILIKCNDRNKIIFLKSIGAKRTLGFGIKWYLAYKTDIDLAKLFTKLRDEDFFFSYDQHGWGPSGFHQGY